MINNSDKNWLIVIDLDGTLLKTPKSSIAPAPSVDDFNLKIIKACMEIGHQVAIVTGRPWRDTKEIYNSLGLKTIVGNYNGANIHHPHDAKFSPIITGMNRDFFKKIAERIRSKGALLNFIIEGPSSTHVLNLKDKDMLEQFHILNGENVYECSLDLVLNENPQTFIFRVDHKKVDKNELITDLRRNFGEAFSFRFWIKPEKDMVNIEVNPKSISKGFVLRYIASYYNIPISRTIAFGDGENDLEMLSTAQVGVAMKNASDLVKSYANDISDFTNDKDGVGKYLQKFFKIK